MILPPIPPGVGLLHSHTCENSDPYMEIFLLRISIFPTSNPPSYLSTLPLIATTVC